MDMRLVLAALITLATVGYASTAHDADGGDDVETLIKRLEEVLDDSDLRKRDRDELEDLEEAVLEIEVIKWIKPMKRWWNVSTRFDTDTTKDVPVKIPKNGTDPTNTGRR